MFYKLKCVLRHLWLDASDTRKAISPGLLDQLTQRVAASEVRHTGQVSFFIEAALPLSYVWRLGAASSMAELVRQRAVMLFSKLRVWDTAQNNGVLIYLLLAEHAIEIVADRAIAQRVGAGHWQAVVDRLGKTLAEGHFEAGLTEALAEVSALLVAHYPRHSSLETSSPGNELPDKPVLG